MNSVQKENAHIPKHIAIIMDGNGRWAKQRGKLRLAGHHAGLTAVRETVRTAGELGVSALTLYAFSSENWKRPADEVDGLMSLFIYALQREAKSLHKNNVQLRIIGDTSLFPKHLQERIQQVEQLTAHNQGLILSIAANYGGRWDVTQACKAMLQQMQNQTLECSEITESMINDHISLNDLPDVDLVIRTGGEYRISNFLLWQIAYAELYFTDLLWPDFNRQAFIDAIEAFSLRERRFGSV